MTPSRDDRGLCAVCGLREGHRDWCERITLYLRAEARKQYEREPRAPRFCAVVGCDELHRARGLCQRHYDALRRRKPVAA